MRAPAIRLSSHCHALGWLLSVLAAAGSLALRAQPTNVSTNVAAAEAGRSVTALVVNSTTNSSTTNSATNAPATPPAPPELKEKWESARKFLQAHQGREAEPLLIELLGEKSPEWLQQQALLDLAVAAAEQRDLARAVQIYAQFLSRWAHVVQVPEVLLRQGQLFRQMGLNNQALVKFYGVMTSALVLKNDASDQYQRLVLQAQVEIAQTHFQLGKYVEAAECFSRLLKQNNPALERPATQFRLIRSLAELGRSEETVAQASDFLLHWPEAPEQPEVRFHLAQAQKQLGRNQEAMQQVLSLLQEQKQRAKANPQVWAYWQQRAGNEIGNQLYQDADYARALDIYLNLIKLDGQSAWQLPLLYQIALTYERLAQPEKALAGYQDLIQRETEAGPNVSPGLQALFDMARWRTNFIRWQAQAEHSTDALKKIPAGMAAGGK